MGGTEIAILSLISRLANDNVKIYIGYTDDKSDIELLNRYKDYAEVVKVTEEINVDILINCSPYSTAFKLCDIIKRDKTYLWFHHFGGRDESILSNEGMIKKLDKIVVVSEYTKQLMLNQPYKDLVKDKIEVIYNVINAKKIIESSKEVCNLELSKTLNIVTVSRLCHEKGFKRVKIVAKYLKEKNIDFKWYIIGSSYYAKIEKEIIKSFKEYKDNFVFMGFLDNPFPIVRQCDYLALLSDEETWGLVLTESKILKVPCIVSNFDVAYEQITDNVDGIILDKHDTDSYKDKIDTILNSKEKLKSNLENFQYTNKEIVLNWKSLLNI